MNRKLIAIVVVIIVVGLVAGIFLVQRNQELRKKASGPGGSDCGQSTDCVKLDSPPNAGAYLVTRAVDHVIIKAGTADFSFPGYSGTCYTVSISSDRVDWEKVGTSGPECQNISHIEIWFSAASVTGVTPSPIAVATSTPTPTATANTATLTPLATSGGTATKSPSPTPTRSPSPTPTRSPSPTPTTQPGIGGGSTVTPTATPIPSHTPSPTPATFGIGGGSTATPTPTTTTTSLASNKTPTPTPGGGVGGLLTEASSSPRPQGATLPVAGDTTPTWVLGIMGISLITAGVYIIANKNNI